MTAVVVVITNYYTSMRYQPVQKIARASETGHERAKRADQKADRGGVVFPEEKQNEQDRRDRADGHDLPVQVSFRSFLHRAGNLLHPLIAR